VAAIRAALRKVGTDLLGEDRYERLSAPLRDLPSASTFAVSRDGRVSRDRLHLLRDTFAGKRCFIIGNGPSLNLLDLKLLRNEHTFALNRGYLAFERMGGPATFLVAVNRNVLTQFADDLNEIDSWKFVDWCGRSVIDADDRTMFLRSRSLPGFYGEDIAGGVWQGSTVTYVALQIAFYLGFSSVYLIGVDHYFAVTGTPNMAVVSPGEDKNHFSPDYFGSGVTWQFPDLEMSERAYRYAREAFDQAGRRVINATEGGSLEVFPRARYGELF